MWVRNELKEWAVQLKFWWDYLIYLKWTRIAVCFFAASIFGIRFDLGHVTVPAGWTHLISSQSNFSSIWTGPSLGVARRRPAWKCYWGLSSFLLIFQPDGFPFLCVCACFWFWQKKIVFLPPFVFPFFSQQLFELYWFSLKESTLQIIFWPYAIPFCYLLCFWPTFCILKSKCSGKNTKFSCFFAMPQIAKMKCISPFFAPCFLKHTLFPRPEIPGQRSVCVWYSFQVDSDDHVDPVSGYESYFEQVGQDGSFLWKHFFTNEFPIKIVWYKLYYIIFFDRTDVRPQAWLDNSPVAQLLQIQICSLSDWCYYTQDDPVQTLLFHLSKGL